MTYNVPTREELPDALVAEPQWICWRDQDRDGTPTKIPVDPATGDYASTTDPETWAVSCVRDVAPAGPRRTGRAISMEHLVATLLE